MPILEVKNLSKSYPPLQAVNNISFEVPEGICFGLLGPNGAGKTTTLEMIEGIVKPTSGDIFIFGEPATQSLYQQLGIQFQHTALQDYLTVKETLVMFAALYPKTMSLDQLIHLCNLEPILNQDHRKLSGGQRQRLLLALALVNDPKLIFLDEPTTGLDPHARRSFWDLIKRIKDQNKTIVLTTHYMDEAEYLCDDIVIMEQGEIIAHNTPKNLLAEHFSGALIRLSDKHINAEQLSDLIYQKHEGFIEITSDNVEQTITTLLKKGISLESLHVKSANLDDLFIKLTGHGLGGHA
ncbi:ABC transporter ATP-binding protein [Flocculibacter collagenilyticus]|uniref:ABC transporter ATP-binding protein n=1 Tax=Flocculibacter collagenilyticus TaxID=2744479 RepID=UPI0018F55FF1|nr:ABC transporter ATP-binding protein [Flocculibacter collagenilyticus]